MPDEVTGQMMQIMLSQYVGNSAGYVFQQAGKLHGFLYDKVPPQHPAFTSADGPLTPQRQDLPSWSPIRLNTNSWARACALFFRRRQQDWWWWRD
jgi:hypothetical protein